MKNWFNNWEWLKCSGNQWNFGRVFPFVLATSNLIFVLVFGLLHDFRLITNCWQIILYCSGFIAACYFYTIEIVFREKPKLKIGGNEIDFRS